MKKIGIKMLKYCPIIFILFLTLTNCSYMMDAIEGTIDNRASFSISARLDGDTVYITWDEIDSSDSFAGYEIEMTKSPDDEYSGYATVAARYDLNVSILPASLSFQVNPGLGISTTKSFNHNVYQLSNGVYYYRMGIIYWNDAPDKRTSKNGYEQTGSPAWDTQTNYFSKTGLNKISGYAKIIKP